jgi:hypothetical protein
MNQDNEFYSVIGKIITASSAVESKIDCIIATEYTGSSVNPQYSLIIDELLEANKMSFSNKIDILLSIAKRRGIVFERITKSELKNDLPKLRNDLAHCHLEYEVKGVGDVELKFKMRKEYKTLEDMRVKVEDISERALMELEHKFFDELWGDVREP